ncbi:MAG: LPXTG cell wall anchor domain-containing protein [Nanoarchaeota archaeon]|nr:LPXTG cell wall anchor domain-containing protein [Nanoarchaeota archaeon]
MDLEIWLWETIPYLVGLLIGVGVVIWFKRKKK